METLPNLDHVVLAVPDLDEAIERFRDLGFTVLPGGLHQEAPTHNALIGFQDATYIELIGFLADEAAWTGEETPSLRLSRSWRAAPFGLVHFALSPTDIEADITRCNTAGADYDGPFLGGRVRPDGKQVRWCIGIPGSRALPFFCGDVTPRQYRIPGGASAVHDNGMLGIAEVTVAVRDLQAMAPLYAAVTCQHPSPDARGGVGFRLGSCAIRLTEAACEDEEGICALTLWASDSAAEGLLPSSETYGAHMALLPHPDPS